MATTDTRNSIPPSPDSDMPLTIVPGLTGLNLNILHAIDMHMIDNAKDKLSKLILKEHPVVANVEKTTIALLKTRIPKEKAEARIELEDIVQKSPTNLNALADLETLYRDLNRSIDADRCRCEIEKLLNGENDEDIQVKRTCLLEQGYAILIERTIVNENTVELRISDLCNILIKEEERSTGKRLEYLERGIQHQKQALRNIHQAYEETTEDSHLVRKGSSLHKFRVAENLSSLPLPHPVWNYYYAKALNQYYDSLHQQSEYVPENEEEMIEVTVQAVSKFWHFAQLTADSDIETFIARSYAYIGQILIKQSRRDGVKSQQEKYDFIRHKQFQRFLNDPFETLEKANTLQPNDITVLNRYGRSYWNLSLETEDKTDKIKYLKKANYILTQSIKCDADRNWWAYSTRMLVRLHLCNNLIRTESDEAKEYLENAEKDGLMCFKYSTNVRRDMSVLADVCERLSKFPDINKYGPEFVHCKEYLYKALDYLFYARHLGDPIDFYWTNRVSSCLFDLGEYEQAVDWQRKTWLISSPKRTNTFYILCMYIFTRFEKDHKLDDAKAREGFLKEFMYTLIYAEEKYKGEDVSPSINKLYKYQRFQLLKILKSIIVEKIVPVYEEEKSGMLHFLSTLINVTYKNRELQELKNSLQSIAPEIQIEYSLYDIFDDTSLKPLAKAVKSWSKDFKYDFFVCHSHKDGDWVVKTLLRHLEGTLDGYDFAFKGCIADRDFIPGKSVLDNILKAIKESRRVILVLTPDFVSSGWCNYEADQAIMQSLNLDPDKNFVIPVVRKQCKIPDKLAHLNYCDMTAHGDFLHEIFRLKKALLPDEN